MQIFSNLDNYVPSRYICAHFYIFTKKQPFRIEVIFSPSLVIRGSAVVWWLMPRTPDPEVGGSSPLGSNRVVSLSKAHLLPQSTGNTH